MGFRRCSFLTDRAMRRPLHRGTGSSTGSTFFLYVIIASLIQWTNEGRLVRTLKTNKNEKVIFLGHPAFDDGCGDIVFMLKG